MPPTANAGADQTVSEYTIVTLDGAKSAADYIYSYRWQQLDGPPVALSDPTASQPTFVAPQLGKNPVSLQFKLVTVDSSGLKSTDTCFVNVAWADNLPDAVAGFDISATAGSVVNLDGSKSTAPGGIAQYQWHQKDGAPVTLSNPNAATPNFTAASGGQYGNTLDFMLILTDKTGMRSRGTQTY